MEKTTIRLNGAYAEIAENGKVTIIQDDQHAVELSPEQMYGLIVWAVEYHLHYLDFKAHEQTASVRCFECREPVGVVGSKTYHLDEGAVTLCSPCVTDVEQTVREEIRQDDEEDAKMDALADRDAWEYEADDASAHTARWT